MPNRLLFLKREPPGTLGVEVGRLSFLNWLIKAIESPGPVLLKSFEKQCSLIRKCQIQLGGLLYNDKVMLEFWKKTDGEGGGGLDSSAWLP